MVSYYTNIVHITPYFMIIVSLIMIRIQLFEIGIIQHMFGLMNVKKF